MSLASIHHSFNIDLAAQYGVEKALLIHHFQYWLRFNRHRKKNIRNGKVWSYQSRADICAHFPYMTFDQIRRHLESLVTSGILVTANYNRAKFDKTLWYSFADEKAFGVDEESSKKFYERQNCPTKGESALREGESARPIPDTKESYSKKGSDKSEQCVPPNPPKGGKPPPKIERAPNVHTTEEEHRRLCEEYGNDIIQQSYERLSQWKTESRKIKKNDNDNLKIRKWVIAAVFEAKRREEFVQRELKNHGIKKEGNIQSVEELNKKNEERRRKWRELNVSKDS